MAEACGSRIQFLDSQRTANDDVAASARFEWEPIGISTVHCPAKLCLVGQFRGDLEAVCWTATVATHSKQGNESLEVQARLHQYDNVGIPRRQHVVDA
jgi:hypothetical protein